ncbi:ATP-binding protein [Streptomyces sp. NPDC060243]|uniref:HD domain-containing protein n=1 Tax=Streptomyces sp. NPDC060243 TaxID=3347081 RepID=UPI003669DA14
MSEGDSHNSMDGTVVGNVFQAKNLYLQAPREAPVPPGTSEDEAEPDAWVRAAGASAVWDLVPPERETREHRSLVAAVVGRLAASRREPGTDPWHDAEVPLRFLEHIERLTEPDGLDLFPAEAALLVLLPFLHRTHYLRRAAEVAGVEPWSLAVRARAEPVRRRFEVFAEGHEALVRRARRNAAAEPVVGWWLFHRWLARDQEFAEPESVAGMLAELGECVRPLGGVLDAERLATLLHGLRRGPDVCHPEHLHQLPEEDRVRSGSGPQRIRFRRLALLATLAHGMAVEAAGLPDIVAEHVAIPYPVDMAGLRRTLAGATWGGTAELPVLRAECHHEAVVEALHAYTARLDTVLHAVRATGIVPLALPARLSSSGVVPGRGVFEGYARFRSDDRRFLSLAVGVELYKDRDLAVRELYQNALDACRYRRARSQYLDRTGALPNAYEGGIRFTQDVDEDGRRYVECEDNGVGMGEAELRGVFSHAGARFAEQAEFRLERARWEALDPPVRLYPNSRFGIGVLSYFMLAEEIRVTTCRMSPEGVPGPVLRASVCGPEHLFRIVREADRGAPGTKVRLYLREGVVAEEWSCVNVLKRVLGVAEFGTVAGDGTLWATWEAGRLQTRDIEYRFRESPGINASGWSLAWTCEPEGAQVFWCQEGGGLLVDGLVVSPLHPSGVLARTDAGLAGAVVNLRGPDAPERLSVDRQHVVDDAGPAIGALLERAAAVFADVPADFPLSEWFRSVMNGSAALADIVGDAFARQGREITHRGVPLCSPLTGTFPADVSLLLPEQSRGMNSWVVRPEGYAPDHIYVWRVLAHGRRDALRSLAELCPEVLSRRPLRTARASDQWLLVRARETSQGHWPGRRLPRTNIDSHAYGRPARALAAQLMDLGYPHEGEASPHRPLRTPLHRPTAAHDPARRARREPLGTAENERWGRTAETEPLLRLSAPGSSTGLRLLGPGGDVPPGHIAALALALDLPNGEVCRRLSALGLGLRIDSSGLPGRPDHELLRLLSRSANGEYPWLERREPATPRMIVTHAEALGLPPLVVRDRLGALGFTVPAIFPEDADAGDFPSLPLWKPQDFMPPGPLPYAYLFADGGDPEALRKRIARLRAYGFDLPLEVPARPGPFDAEILSAAGAWRELTSADVIPFHFVLPLARDLNIPPADVVRVLASYRMRVSRDELPDGMSFREAVALAGVDMRHRALSRHDGFPLHFLHHTALLRDTTIRRVVAQLRDLGFTVPDPADTLRVALARVPSA